MLMIWFCSSVSRGFCASRIASSSFLFRISSFFLCTSSSVSMTAEKSNQILIREITRSRYCTACPSSATTLVLLSVLFAFLFLKKRKSFIRAVMRNYILLESVLRHLIKPRRVNTRLWRTSVLLHQGLQL